MGPFERVITGFKGAVEMCLSNTYQDDEESHRQLFLQSGIPKTRKNS